MRIPIAIFVVLLCCVLCFSDQTVALLASPRALLVCVLLFWLRCEWCMRLWVDTVCLKVEAMVGLHRESKMVRENFELSQTVMNLSDQHTLLCEIRSGVHKSVKCSRDVLGQLNGSPSPVLLPLSSSSSPLSISEVRRQFCKGSMSEDCIRPAREQFRKRGMSEGCIRSTPIPYVKLE